MKKTLMVLVLALIATTSTYAYSGYVRSPDYGYGITNSVTYYDGVGSSNYLSYSLYVQSYGEARIDVGSGKSWREGNPNTYANGYFYGPFSYVTLSASVNAVGGFAYASATW